MFNGWLSKNKVTAVAIASPLTGEAVPLTEVPDEAFAGKYMGDGVAIKPGEGKLVAPFDGVIAHLIDSKHAVIIEHASGLQLLVHIGINTVALQGKGFKAFVATGDKVTAGQTLIEFDPELIQAEGYPLITPVVIANQEITERLEYDYKTVVAGEPALLQAVLKK